MIDRATVDRIYAAADIVEIVSDFVTLRKKGVNYQACCPFHNEKTPSFIVSPAKGLFKCFGCGKGGNAVTFVMEHEKLSYTEALKYVARKYGIEVQEKELTPQEKQHNDDRESMMVLNSWAADYFRRALLETDEGLSVGLSYFRKRGFTDATVKKFQLGYCPSKGDAFSTEALRAGYKEQFITDTGLGIKRETGGWYDRFAGRVIFPVHSISGRIIAFGGRTLRTDKNTAKYLNSPESAVYSKSHSLYGLYQAKNAVTRENYCILVEGYTDVLQMHQSGVENVVASSGTSLTTDQIKLISRFTHNVTVIYDGDTAGIKASLRGIDMILKEGLNVRVVLLPPEDDPDSFARARSAAEVKEYIQAHEEDFIRFKTRLLMNEAAGDPIRKAELIADIVESISVIPDPIMRSVFIKDCAESMDIGEQILVNEVGRRRMTRPYDSDAGDFVRRQQKEIARETAAVAEALSSRGLHGGSSMAEMEKELAGCLIKHGHQWFELKEGGGRGRFNVAETIIGDLTADGIALRDERYRAIFDTYRAKFEELGAGVKVPEHFFTNHDDPQVCNAAVDILTSDENYVASELWKKHEKYFESEEEKLPVTVPRLVILYKSKAVEAIISELNSRLASDGLPESEQTRLVESIAALNRVRNEIAHKVARLIL